MITAAVIDDDKYTVEVFAEYLGIIGVKVVAVGSNGKIAAEIYKKHKPDITFMDLMMPEYDGVFGLSEIRNLDPNANVIIITADLTMTNSEKLEPLNPTGIFYKPFDIEKIQLMIRKITNPKDYLISHSKEKEALVSFTISSILAKMSPSATNEVGNRLYAKHHCYFSDCLKHPEYLREVLTDVFGNGAKIIMSEIRQNLEEFEDQHPISHFLAVLSK